MPNIPPKFNGQKFINKFGVLSFHVEDNKLICPSLPNLTEEDIADCIDDPWFFVRKTRKRLLEESDWTQAPDAALSLSEKVDWQVYRQALRDIPQTYENPEDVQFPTPPGGA